VDIKEEDLVEVIIEVEETMDNQIKIIMDMAMKGDEVIEVAEVSIEEVMKEIIAEVDIVLMHRKTLIQEKNRLSIMSIPVKIIMNQTEETIKGEDLQDSIEDFQA